MYTWLVEAIPTFIDKPAENKNLSNVRYYFWYQDFDNVDRFLSSIMSILIMCKWTGGWIYQVPLGNPPVLVTRVWSHASRNAFKRNFCESITETTTRRRRKNPTTTQPIAKPFALHTNAITSQKKVTQILWKFFIDKVFQVLQEIGLIKIVTA